MLRTKFTELFHVKYPIMQGGMQHLGVPKLAAAVSNAGGLGTINITIYPQLDHFRKALQEMNALTDKPYAVNISLVPDLDMGEKIREYIQICREEKVQIIETAGRNPAEIVPDIKAAGMKLIHKCTGVKFAKKAESFGADAVTLAGYEVAGHPGMDEVGSFVLINSVSRAVTIPVLAAGGIADGRGLAAALALGAQGVVIGTRFVASEECIIHRNFKDAIVASAESDTITCQRSIKNMARYMKNETSIKVLELERQGATLEELMPLISGTNSKDCYVSGNLQGCVFAAGQSMGLINSVKTAKEIVDDMVHEAQEVLSDLNGMNQ